MNITGRKDDGKDLKCFEKLPEMTKGNGSDVLRALFNNDWEMKNLFKKCTTILEKYAKLGEGEYVYFDLSSGNNQNDIILLIENDGKGMNGEFIVNNTCKNDYDEVLLYIEILNQTFFDLLKNIKNCKLKGQMFNTSDLLIIIVFVFPEY